MFYSTTCLNDDDDNNDDDDYVPLNSQVLVSNKTLFAYLLAGIASPSTWDNIRSALPRSLQIPVQKTFLLGMIQVAAAVEALLRQGNDPVTWV